MDASLLISSTKALKDVFEGLVSHIVVSVNGYSQFTIASSGSGRGRQRYRDHMAAIELYVELLKALNIDVGVLLVRSGVSYTEPQVKNLMF